MDFLGGGGCAPLLALARWGEWGCYFNDKPEKYERHNEINVIVSHVIQYLSIMFDIFITANCFSPLDV